MTLLATFVRGTRGGTSYNDGGQHVIDSTIECDVSVGSNSLGGTSVVLVGDGAIRGHLRVGEDSLATIEGGNIDGSALSYGDGRLRIAGGTIDATLSGTLADGTVFSNRVFVCDECVSSFSVVAVPEPSPGVLTALGLLSLACIAFCKRLLPD